MTGELKAAIETDDIITQVWPRIGLAGYRGSIAHGTAGDVIDDVDIGGVFISPVSHYFGLTKLEHVDRVCVADKYDFALFEIKKYFKLLLNSNPNVLSLLWLPQNLYITQSEWGREIVKYRHIFMSKKLYKSFGGYAYGQLRRMTHPCTNQAFQGKKRRERFEKFGYDCKNAAHLIRLLRMGIESLTTGEISVARHDAKQLRAIKIGEWSLKQIENEAERLQHLLDEAFVKSDLPTNPNYRQAEQLLINILSSNI